MNRKQIIKRILNMRADRVSYQDIARTLESEGIPTFSGRGKWRKQTVHKLVQQNESPPKPVNGKPQASDPAARIAALEAENNRLLSGIEEAEKEIAKVKKERKKFWEETCDFAQRLSNAQVRNELLEQDVKATLKKLEEQSAEVGRIRQLNTEAWARNTELKKQIKASGLNRAGETENAALREKLGRAGKKAAAFEAEVRERIRQIDAERRENADLRDKIAELEKLVKSRSEDTQPDLFQDDIPTHIVVDGQRWGIQRKRIGKYRYYYAVKKIGGKHQSVSIGKRFDGAKAVRKVRAKLEKLSQPAPEKKATPHPGESRRVAPRDQLVRELIFRHGNKGQFARIERVRADYERHHNDFDPLLAMLAARYQIELHVGGAGGNLSAEEINGAYYDADGDRYLTVSWCGE